MLPLSGEFNIVALQLLYACRGIRLAFTCGIPNSCLEGCCFQEPLERWGQVLTGVAWLLCLTLYTPLWLLGKVQSSFYGKCQGIIIGLKILFCDCSWAVLSGQWDIDSSPLSSCEAEVIQSKADQSLLLCQPATNCSCRSVCACVLVAVLC